MERAAGQKRGLRQGQAELGGQLLGSSSPRGCPEEQALRPGGRGDTCEAEGAPRAKPRAGTAGPGKGTA